MTRYSCDISSMCTTLAHPTPITFPHHVQRSSAETDHDDRLSVKRSDAGKSGRRRRDVKVVRVLKEREKRGNACRARDWLLFHREAIKPTP